MGYLRPMTHVQVRVHIAAPIETVFDAVSDHEHFLHADDGTRTKVITDGKTERNGLGCRREVTVGTRARYVEEITAWDKPTSFEYRIRETSHPIAHAGSRLTFTPADGGTDVEWTSRFRVTVPIVGPLIGLVAHRIFRRAFTGLLQATKSRLEGVSSS
jgi:uncharacterized protein YndB with AHSA1/START domain